MIKFRAWDKVSETMHKVEGIRFGINGARVISLAEMNRYNNNHTRWHTDVELLQFTGLKDKNGVEIYEGDVVKNNYDEIGYIRWFKGSFDFCDTEGDAFYLFSMGAAQPFEIIGNKFEHPHLLEE